MKKKLTIQYVLSVGLVAVLILIVNFFAMVILLYMGQSHDDTSQEVESYVRDFRKHILVKQNKVIITNEGKKSLARQGLWIQVLDDHNQEVTSYLKPQSVKNSYSAIELINGYKYAGTFDDSSEMLFGEKKVKEQSYIYMIGYPMRMIRKYMVIINNETLSKDMTRFFWPVILIDFITVLLLGFLFSKRLTRPINKVITGISTLADNTYKPLKTVGVYKPVFEQLNLLSTQLEINRVEREQMHQMRQEWVANISHDIKTPLASIKGYSELLEMEPSLANSDALSYLQVIQAKADYLSDLVEDLNLVMKLENKQTLLQTCQVNLVNLIKSLIIELFNDPDYKDVEVAFSCNQGSIMRSLDAKLIKRAITNLIQNAVFHNDKKVKIDISVEEKEDVEIIVIDNGKGVNQQELPNLFKRYYRGTNTGEAHKGSGLGMAIVQEIIVAHNGQISVKNGSKSGLEVTIILP
ncbi:sensor histidine kinase [Streptococcus dysgalactiae subsp. equisimilis]|uniref:sensor histidine kinase n=1 Tax=Streptococcus dysgalactiae TaxID=1334 RepID=UPI003FD8B377